MGFIRTQCIMIPHKHNYLIPESRFAWEGTENVQLPDLSGVYFLLSHNGKKLQKIGKADGQYGLRGRLKAYTSKKTKKKLEEYATDRLWMKVMKGELLGQSLSVYYYLAEPEVRDKMLNASPDRGGEEYILNGLEYQWARSFEKKLSNLATEMSKANEDIEMLLSGQD